MNSLKLHTGDNVPQLGLGTWKSEPNRVGTAVEYALTQSGYRHIDCAHVYKNEPEIGEAFSRVFSAGSAKREDIFITSKLWNTAHHPKDVRGACELTLKNLQLDYLDLYLMHWGTASDFGEPVNDKSLEHLAPISIRDTWEVMEQLVDDGLVKSIGVSNFTVMMLLDLLTYALHRPVMNQVEVHPYNTQERLVQLCKDVGVQVTAYSPLGSPGNRLNPKYQHGEEFRLLDEKIVHDIAAEVGKTATQVLIRFALQRDICVIPKSCSPEHIQENIEVSDFSLLDEQMQKIMSLNCNHRFVDPVHWNGIPYFE